MTLKTKQQYIDLLIPVEPLHAMNDYFKYDWFMGKDNRDLMRITSGDATEVIRVLYHHTGVHIGFHNLMSYFAQNGRLRNNRTNAAKHDIILEIDILEDLGLMADRMGYVFPDTPITRTMQRKERKRLEQIGFALDKFGTEVITRNRDHETEGMTFPEFYRCFQYFTVTNELGHARIEDAKKAYELSRYFAGYPENQHRKLQGLSVRTDMPKYQDFLDK